MDFYDNRRALTSGVAYRGEPASMTEVFDAVAEGQRRIDNDAAMRRYLEEAYDKRNKEIEALGLKPPAHPFWHTPSAEEAERIFKFGQREGDVRGQVGQSPFSFPPRSVGSELKDISQAQKAVYLMRQYEADLDELARANPDLATRINPKHTPFHEVTERMRQAEKRRDDMWAGRSEAYSWFNIPQVIVGVGAGFAGGLYGQIESPRDLAANFLGGVSGARSQSLLRNALKNAFANAGVQSVLEPGIQAQRQAAGLESGLMNAIESIASAGAIGGALDIGFRAPARAFNRATGQPGPYGGWLRDAPDPAAPRVDPAETPEPQATPAQPIDLTIDPELRARAEAGDLAAMREIVDKVDVLKEDPVVRGALAEVEIETRSPIEIEGVDRGDGLKATYQLLMSDLDPQEPKPRLPDPIPEARSVLEPERGTRLYDEYAGPLQRLMEAAEERLNQVDPRLVQRIDRAIEAGIGEVLEFVEKAVKKIDGGAREEAVARAFVRDLLSLANNGGLDRLGAVADMHSGLADPLELARAMRAYPDIIDSNIPDIENVTLARSLARLSDQAFDMVDRGEVDPILAQVVSDHVPNLADHAGVLDGIKDAGITDPDTARRAITDLLPPDRDPDAIPSDQMSGVDDPAGPEAKADLERMRVEMAPEMAEHAAKLEARKQQAEAAAQAKAERVAMVERAEEVRAAIAGTMGIVPSDYQVKVFSSFGDLPEGAAADVMRANAKAFTDAIDAFQSAPTEEARLAARAALDAAKAGRFVDAFTTEDTIWIGAHAMNPQGRMAHEVVHALVASGRLSRDELALLADAGRRSNALTPDREATYRAAYGERNVSPERLVEMLDEEAAAHLVEAWDRVKPMLERAADSTPNPVESTRIDGIVARIQAFFGSVREAIERALGRSSQTSVPDKAPQSAQPANPVTTLLDAILSGEIAKREGIARVMRQEDVSAVAVRGEGGMYAISDRDQIDAKIDAPNFGLSSPPRVLPDDHPLLQPRDGDTSPERLALRDRLVDQRFAGKQPVPETERPVVYLMGGGGASGKGTILKTLRKAGLVDETFVELDPDSFKTGDKGRGWEGIPEYWEIDAAGDSRGASTTHEESSLTYKAAQKRGMAGRFNLVMDQTLGNSDKGVALIQSLKDAGYEVHLIGVTADPAIAIERAVKRAKGKERRYVPLDQLLIAHKGFSSGFERYSQLADSAVLYDTSDGMPHAVAEKKLDSALSIKNEKRYSEFARKATLNEKASTLRELQASLVGLGSPRQADPRAVAGGYQGTQGGLDPQRAQDPAGVPGQRLDYAMYAISDRLTGQEMRRAIDSQPVEKAVTGQPITIKTYRGRHDSRHDLFASWQADRVYASSDPNVASVYARADLAAQYAETIPEAAAFEPRTFPLYMRFQNPFVIDTRGSSWDEISFRGQMLTTDQIADIAKSEGHDGVIFRDILDQGPMATTVVALDKNTVTSATSGQLMFAFAGEKAKTADLDALARAKVMEMEGAKREDIWTETGWFRAPDGRWKWEIDDSNAQLTGKGAGRLDRVLNHGGLYDAYPDIAKTKTEPLPSFLGMDMLIGGGYRPPQPKWFGLTTDRGSLVYSRQFTGADRVGKILHEGQHAIQARENFADGGSSRTAAEGLSAAEKKTLIDNEVRSRMDRVSYIKQQNILDEYEAGVRRRAAQNIDTLTYNVLAGEVEARAVEKRMDLTPEQRRSRPPWLDYDVPEDQQIVRFADGSSGPMFAIRDDQPVTPGLDMSPEARKARAEQMGFDTSIAAYRGLTRPYDGSKTNYYQMFTSNPWEAGEYAMANPLSQPNVIAAYIRKGKNLEIDAMGRPFNRIQVQHGKLPADMRGKLDSVSSIDEIAHAARLAGYDTVTVRNVVDNATGEVIPAPKSSSNKVSSAELDAILAELGPIDMDAAPPAIVEGYTGVPPDKRGPVTVNVVFDPARNVRSINAAFDPAQSQSPNLMYAIRSDLDMSPESRRVRAKAWRHPEGQTEAGKKYSAMSWFHGANRVDRIADAGKFDPKRATSGPMPFFTDAPELASKYATGKQDTSMPDIEHMSQYFTVSPKDMGSPRERTPYTVEQTWFRLSPEQRSTILSRVKRIGFENIDQADGPLVLHPEGVEAINGEHFDSLMRREERGNPLGALRNYWVDSGNLFGSEEDLVRIYQLAGYPFRISTKTAPWYEAPGIIPVVLQLRNPLVTSDDGAIAKVVAALDVALKGDRTRKAEGGADAWDKNTRYTPKEWLAQLKEDAASGANSFVWTSIPDKITAELRKLGYDGIVDTGGKKGGDTHNVAIPFSPQQVRSVNAAFDPAQSASPNLMFAIRDDATPDEVSRLASRLSDLAGQSIPDLQPRITAALDAVAALREAAAERGIDEAMAPNIIDLAQATATRALSQAIDILGPERTARVMEGIQAALADVPADPQAIAQRINQILDQVYPEEQPRAPANDNPDLGPMSPVETELYLIERLGQISEMIGVCR